MDNNVGEKNKAIAEFEKMGFLYRMGGDKKLYLYSDGFNVWFLFAFVISLDLIYNYNVMILYL